MKITAEKQMRNERPCETKRHKFSTTGSNWIFQDDLGSFNTEITKAEFQIEMDLLILHS